MHLLSRVAQRALGTAARSTLVALLGSGTLVYGSLTLTAAVQKLTSTNTTDFTSITTPFTGGTAFATAFPESPSLPPGVGPIGMLDDGSHFYVNDFANGLLYNFSASLGGKATGAPSADDSLHGLALFNGTYYGTKNGGKMVEAFDPATLALKTMTIPLPCGGLGLTGDPMTGNLWVDTTCGVYLVENPTTAIPTVQKFSPNSDGYDGIAISPDGQDLWAADDTASSVIEFSRTGTVLATVPDPGGPDGIVIAPANASVDGVDVSGNVFVNNNNGTVVRINMNDNNQLTTVASGGSRGDYATVGLNGCIYVTQSDQVDELTPCIQINPPTSPSSPTTTDAPTTVPSTTPTTVKVETKSSGPTTDAAPAPVTASSGSLPFTGIGNSVVWTGIVGSILVLLGLAMVLVSDAPRRLYRFLGRR